MNKLFILISVLIINSISATEYAGQPSGNDIIICLNSSNILAITGRPCDFISSTSPGEDRRSSISIPSSFRANELNKTLFIIYEKDIVSCNEIHEQKFAGIWHVLTKCGQCMLTSRMPLITEQPINSTGCSADGNENEFSSAIISYPMIVCSVIIPITLITFILFVL